MDVKYHNKRGEGLYVADRSALQPGAVTRREWIRFLHKIQQGDLCTCQGTPHRHWLWQAGLEDGYGRFEWRGRMYLAHRFAHIALRGAIPPPDQEPDHLCRIRDCCNPACIEVVTPKVNRERGLSICAKEARQTHCKNGHEFTEENLDNYHKKLGLRMCRLCFNLWQNRDRARKRAERTL